MSLLPADLPYDALVVGGGFVGVAAADELLARAPAGWRIGLINGGGPLGRGLAYGTDSELHLLNVPAARMSWQAARPDDFCAWLDARGLPHAPADFVPRLQYGAYLADRLAHAVAARPDLQWHQGQGRVQRLAPASDGWQVDLEAGGRLQARRVLLALGNFAPACPHPGLAGLPASRYAPNPWEASALADLEPDAPLALIGSGLTMLDLLLSLEARGHRGPLLALSRRGLLPQAHRRNELPPPDWRAPPDWLRGPGLRAMLGEFRQTLAQARREGHDWRDLWVALRPRTAALWQDLSPRERAQFLRHLQALWDVHRHRAAPQALAPLRRALAAGRLRLAAGRLLEVGIDGPQLQLQWRARGESATQRFAAVRVFNCTGPSNRIDDDRSPLFAALRRDGRLQPCALGLGVGVDAGYRLLDAQGRPQPGLHYAGPMLKSQHWEATAVPELREHARRAAAALLG